MATLHPTTAYHSTGPETPRSHVRWSKRRGQVWLFKILLSLLALSVALTFLLPAIWMLSGSLQPENDIIKNVTPLSWHTLIPQRWTFQNYLDLFGPLGFTRPLLNSLFVTVVSVIIGLALSLPAAYGLSVLRFRGRDFLFGLLVIGFMVPFDAIAVPLAHLFTNWHLSDTYTALILPGIGNGLAVFNLRQAFLDTPSSVREGAVIDGASEIRILASIYVPLNITPVINSGLLIFLAQWHAYLWPLLIMSSKAKQVAAVALARTYTDAFFNFGQMFGAALVISIVPAALLGFLQRHFALSIATEGEK